MQSTAGTTLLRKVKEIQRVIKANNTNAWSSSSPGGGRLGRVAFINHQCALCGFPLMSLVALVVFFCL